MGRQFGFMDRFSTDNNFDCCLHCSFAIIQNGTIHGKLYNVLELKCKSANHKYYIILKEKMNLSQKSSKVFPLPLLSDRFKKWCQSIRFCSLAIPPIELFVSLPIQRVVLANIQKTSAKDSSRTASSYKIFL